jgi:hypothetical protein
VGDGGGAQDRSARRPWVGVVGGRGVDAGALEIGGGLVLGCGLDVNAGGAATTPRVVIPSEHATTTPNGMTATKPMKARGSMLRVI